jgi:hypothetical protein
MIKQLIDELARRSEIIQGTRDEVASIEGEQSGPLEYLIDKFSESGIDTAYIEDLCRLLQLSNNQALIEQYSLNDVEKLLAAQNGLQPNNPDSYLEYAHFYFSILDQNEKARKIALDGISVAEEKLKELKKLIAEIEEDALQ